MIALQDEAKVIVDAPVAHHSADVAKPIIQEAAWRWFLPLVVGVAAFLMQRSVALLGLDLHHDTFMFDAARRLLTGEVPYRDYFYQYNLGTVFLHALALKGLGAQIASLKIITALAYALIAVLIYACAAVVGLRWWGLGVALLWSTLSPFHMPALNGYHAWSTVYMMGSVMAGALFLTIALTGRPLLWSLLAGVCFNLSFWFKQVAGLQILVVLVWIVYKAWCRTPRLGLRRRFRLMLAGYAIGGLVSALPLFYYLYEQSLFEDWWRSAFTFNGLFAATGNSASGLVALARTFFPVARDIGYVSVVWALLPLCLMAIILGREPGSRNRLFSRSDAGSLGVSLFAVLGIAGWLEYFPLAHAFHTQLFMAPVFVLFALPRNEKGSPLPLLDSRWLVTAMLILSTVVAVYEAIRHLHGLRTKTSQPRVVLGGDMPTTGLRLSQEHAQSFEAFYRALLAAKKEAGDSPLIPMSVDPLRALLPDQYHEPPEFKMGVNWTWPNEIVEPGFNEKLAVKIAERKSPIYADSLIGIPGYRPAALLEMPSPITATHTLYVPSSDPMVTTPQTRVVVGDAVCGSSQAFRTVDRPAVVSFDGSPRSLSLIRFDEIEHIPSENIANIHVSIIREVDIPGRLSKFQYESFLKSVPGDLSAKVARLYERRSGGWYERVWPLEQEQMLDVAKFMLSQGKLFESMDRPIFFTTLARSITQRPLLLAKLEPPLNPQPPSIEKQTSDVITPRVVWAKTWAKGVTLGTAGRAVAGEYYLVIPGGAFQAIEEAVLYVQFAMKDNSTRNFYLHYLPSEDLLSQTGEMACSAS